MLSPSDMCTRWIQHPTARSNGQSIPYSLHLNTQTGLKPDLDRAAGHRLAELGAHLYGETHHAALWLGSALVHVGVEVGHVADEGWMAVLNVTMRDEAALPRPVADVVEHPGAHAGAVAVGAWHADQLCVAVLNVPAGRTPVQPVRLRGVDLRLVAVLRHLWQPART